MSNALRRLGLSMETLPNEIILHILKNSILRIADVVIFSSTCLKFREIVNSSRSLWKAKYFQRWPKSDFDIVCENWYNECITRMCFEKQARELLSTMSSEFFDIDMQKIGSPQLDFIIPFINSHKYGYYYLRDFLIAINSLPLMQSLTDKYYGTILMKYIHKRHNKEIWNSLMQLSSQEQTLEKGAVFVTVWCQEFERGLWKKVISELDDIADRVRRHLLQHYLDHPLKTTPEEIRSLWRNENIPGNAFHHEHCKSIIWAMNYVLFEELKYCVTYDFNDLEKKRCGIDHALLDRKANPYVFAVIYDSVARRLGVKIEVLEYTDDCLLRWSEDYNVPNSRSHYIRASSNGIFMTSLCPRKSYTDTLIPPCNMLRMAQRAALYLHPRELRESHVSLRDALELQLVMKPLSLECYQQLYQTHMLHELDAKELIWKLKDIRGQISNPESREFQSLLHSLELYQQIWERNHNANDDQTLVVRNRVDGIDFAVGMIVRDKFWDLAGVIHGWELDGKKVSYKVLVEDGRYQCTPQENLQILHSPPFVSHPSIGRFFDEYCLTYYKPNKELQMQYPQDMDALKKILKKDRQT